MEQTDSYQRGGEGNDWIKESEGISHEHKLIRDTDYGVVMSKGKADGWEEEGRMENGETSAIASSTRKTKEKVKGKHKNEASGNTRNQELWQL